MGDCEKRIAGWCVVSAFIVERLIFCYVLRIFVIKRFSLRSNRRVPRRPSNSFMN